MDAYSWKTTTQITTNAQDLDIFLYLTLLKEHLDLSHHSASKMQKSTFNIFISKCGFNTSQGFNLSSLHLQIFKSLIHSSLLQVLGQLKYQSV